MARNAIQGPESLQVRPTLSPHRTLPLQSHQQGPVAKLCVWVGGACPGPGLWEEALLEPHQLLTQLPHPEQRALRHLQRWHAPRQLW